MADPFTALSSPVRRQLLEALHDGPAAVNDLAARFDLSRPTISEHLAVLRAAGLVRQERDGRRRVHRLDPEPLARAGEWLTRLASRDPADP